MKPNPDFPAAELKKAVTPAQARRAKALPAMIPPVPTALPAITITPEPVTLPEEPEAVEEFTWIAPAGSTTGAVAGRETDQETTVRAKKPRAKKIKFGPDVPI
jgi:hypothetical protein